MTASVANPVVLPPRLYRRATGRLLGGVASGIAEHIGRRSWEVRAAFVLLTIFGGIGIPLYGVYWIVLPRPPGVEPPRMKGGWLIPVIATAVGVAATVVLVRTFPLGGLFIPSLLAVFGAALIWRQAGESQRERWWRLSRSSLSDEADERTGRIRLLSGVGLVVVGGIVVLIGTDPSALPAAFVAVAVTVVGFALITGPWWMRLATDLGSERRERIRSQERAEIAAHLHDSVLQTLALIQRNASSPREVSRLARGQERELRALLYDLRAPTGQLAQSLQTVSGEVEDAYAITIDAVVVGDATLDEHLMALVAASREALINAAKHAGVDSISLYAEVEPRQVVVFVRDRGKGFDVDAVAADRQGVRGSMVGRMERHGGRVMVRSDPGRGTEVEIVLPRGKEFDMTARVFLVDDHAMFRAGVRAELGHDVQLVGEAGTVPDAVEGIKATEPDVVLLDVHMPDGGGLAVISGVGQTSARYLALSVSDAAEDVIAIIRAGARGYVTKTISAADLAAAVRRVADGDVVFSPRLAGFVLDAFRDAPVTPAIDPEIDQLTPRELDVLRLLARGYAYKEIGAQLFISVKTVETHASNVLRKLQLSNRHQLTRWAADRRML